jgi:hypothetical protein
MEWEMYHIVQHESNILLYYWINLLWTLKKNSFIKKLNPILINELR